MYVCVREGNSLGSLGFLGFLGEEGNSSMGAGNSLWSLGSVYGCVGFGNSLGSLGSLGRGSGYVGAVNSLGYLEWGLGERGGVGKGENERPSWSVGFLSAFDYINIRIQNNNINCKSTNIFVFVNRI